MYRKVKLEVAGLKHEFSIDTLGVVRNETNGYVLKGTTISRHNRYVKIHLQKFHALHRLVAEHFLENPLGLPQVNHLDGNRYNNVVTNLEWCTSRDNIKHAYATGLKTNDGEVNPFSKLTEEEVKQIWALRYMGTARQTRDRLRLQVGIGCIKAIRQRKTWTSVTDNLV